jgi:hypothetical protein
MAVVVVVVALEKNNSCWADLFRILTDLAYDYTLGWPHKGS